MVAENISLTPTLCALRSGHTPLSTVATADRSTLALRQSVLETELTQIRTLIQHYDALLAPIRRIPNEILIHIFFCLPVTLLKGQNYRFEMGKVCKHWRTVSRSTTSLWSTIELVAQDPNRGTVPPELVYLVKQYLILSVPHPLDIIISFVGFGPGSLDAINDIMERLCSHVYRWRSFKRTGTPATFCRLLDNASGTLEMLESFSYDILHSDLSDYYGKIHLPVLKTLRASHDHYSHFTGFSETLTTFSGPFEGQESCYSFLSQMRNLRTLQITHIGGDEKMDSSRFPGAPLTLGKVKTFKMSLCTVAPVFNYLVMPQLKYLSVAWCEEDIEICHCNRNNPRRSNLVYALDALLQRSRCTLETLEIGEIEPSSLAPIFQSCGASITTLRVATSMDETITPFLRLLAIDKKTLAANTSPAILPRLKELDFHFWDDGVLLKDDFMAMLKSRWEVPPAASKVASKLQKLALIHEDSSATEDTEYYSTTALAFYLLALQDKRLRVEWKICEDDVLKACRESVQSLR